MLLPLLLGQGVAGTGYTLTALGGSYTLTGTAANLLRNKLITSLGGAYTATGGSAVLKRSKLLSVLGGSYNLTGSSATILKSRYLATLGGTYNLTGANAILLQSRLLVASGGVYTYTGQIAVITYVAGVSGYTLTALGGTYNLIASQATLLRSRLLSVSGGSYQYNTNECYVDGCYIGNTYGLTQINVGKRLTASGGSYIYTGQSAFLYKGTGPVWPLPEQVLSGVTYGPTGLEYTGTFTALTTSIKYDITTGQLVKPINDKVVMTI